MTETPKFRGDSFDINRAYQPDGDVHFYTGEAPIEQTRGHAYIKLEQKDEGFFSVKNMLILFSHIVPLPSKYKYTAIWNTVDAEMRKNGFVDKKEVVGYVTEKELKDKLKLVEGDAANKKFNVYEKIKTIIARNKAHIEGGSNSSVPVQSSDLSSQVSSPTLDPDLPPYEETVAKREDPDLPTYQEAMLESRQSQSIPLSSISAPDLSTGNDSTLSFRAFSRLTPQSASDSFSWPTLPSLTDHSFSYYLHGPSDEGGSSTAGSSPHSLSPESSKESLEGDSVKTTEQRASDQFMAALDRSKGKGNAMKASVLEANEDMFCKAIKKVLAKGNAISVTVGRDHFVIFPKMDGKVDDVKVVRWDKDSEDAQVGKGSYGIITALGKKMVVKTPLVVNSRVVTTKKSAEEMEIELQNVKHLRAQNGGRMPEGLTPVHELIGPNRQRCMLMDRKVGSLDKYPAEKISLQVFTKGFFNVFKGLNFLHNHTDEAGKPESIPHGDIKSANILFDDDGFYLADFGTTKSYDERRRANQAAYTGTLATTPLSEGVALNKLLESNDPLAKIRGQQLDIFHCGLAMYAALSGKRELPFQGSGFGIGDVSKFNARGMEGFEIIREKFGPIHGPMIEKFIKLTLSPNPADRPTAKECMENMRILEAALEGIS